MTKLERNGKNWPRSCAQAGEKICKVCLCHVIYQIDIARRHMYAIKGNNTQNNDDDDVDDDYSTKWMAKLWRMCEMYAIEIDTEMKNINIMRTFPCKQLSQLIKKSSEIKCTLKQLGTIERTKSFFLCFFLSFSLLFVRGTYIMYYTRQSHQLSHGCGTIGGLWSMPCFFSAKKMTKKKSTIQPCIHFCQHLSPINLSETFDSLTRRVIC